MAGARPPFEAYLAVSRVQGLASGLYRYVSLKHSLLPLPPVEDLQAQVTAACLGQGFAGNSAVTFFWTAIPYRTEWRYTVISPKLIALDAGHVCQNLYLACEAIGAYDQEVADAVIGVDGQEEFVIYVAPVGKL